MMPARILLAIVGVAVLVIVLIAAEWRTAAAERECVEHGYPNARVTWGGLGEAFCIRRLDQTDEVTPLESLTR